MPWDVKRRLSADEKKLIDYNPMNQTTRKPYESRDKSSQMNRDRFLPPLPVGPHEGRKA
jgi:hypothetical protein